MNPGHAFRDGTLYVFDEESVEVLRPWGPRAGAWRKVPPGGWRGFTPEISLEVIQRETREVERANARLELWMPFDSEEPPCRVPNAFDQHAASAFRSVLSEIPLGAFAKIRRLGDAHWQALQLVNRCGAPALELLSAVPALGLALATRRRFAKGLAPMRSARSLLRRRLRDIAGRLGFPPSEAVVNVLRKIPPFAVSVSRLKYLRRAFRYPEILERMHHLPRLNIPALRVLCDARLVAAVSDSYLRELTSLKGTRTWGHLPYLLGEVLSLEDRLGLRRSAQFRSVRQVERRHERIVHALTGPNGPITPGLAFPLNRPGNPGDRFS